MTLDHVTPLNPCELNNSKCKHEQTSSFHSKAGGLHTHLTDRVGILWPLERHRTANLEIRKVNRACVAPGTSGLLVDLTGAGSGDDDEGGLQSARQRACGDMDDAVNLPQEMKNLSVRDR
jgi:hypothetical protein